MTIRTFLEDAVCQAPEAPAQKFFHQDRWVTRNYAGLKERVVRAASIVHRLELKPGVESVALMLENCPEWQEIYLALACAGVAVVPLDPKLRAPEVTHILKDSEAVAIFAGARLHDVLSQAIANLPGLRACVWVSEGESTGASLPGRACYAYEVLMSRAATARDAARSWFESHRPDEDTVASIIYTSGTTGKPKGAMLTHGNFTSNVAGTIEVVGFYQADNFLNVLPLFHAFSFTANFMLPLRVKGCCSFVRSLRTIPDDMQVLQPTVMLAVPLMAEKLYARVAERLKRSLLARGLLGIGLKSVIAKKVVESCGGKLRLLGIGGAPTPLAVIKGFRGVGIPVLEGYGLTECSPGVAYPSLAWYVPGTVGRVLPNMQYKMVDVDGTGAGELCVKGPNVMKGYYNNLEATAEVFDAEGYLHTGDLVRFDGKKNMTICGRKKALIVNREGKNIYPEEVEQVIERCPFVKDILVLGYRVGGESGERVGAIAVPNGEAITAWHKGVPLSRAATEAFLHKEVIDCCRAQIAGYKMPRKIVIRHEPLERTSTMKVRRVVYAGSLDEREAEAEALPDLEFAEETASR